MRIHDVKQAFWRHGTDKLGHGYAPVYAKVPADIAAVFEIGVAGGHSLKAWAELFPQAMVYGLDQSDIKAGLDSGRIRQFRSQVQNFSMDLFREQGGVVQFFDLVVDDGGHSADEILCGWRILGQACRGLYVIEDVTAQLVGPIVNAMHNSGCRIVSTIQTGPGNDDRVIVGQFDRVIEW
jgi:hypothetical protein